MLDYACTEVNLYAPRLLLLELLNVVLVAARRGRIDQTTIDRLGKFDVESHGGEMRAGISIKAPGGW